MPGRGFQEKARVGEEAADSPASRVDLIRFILTTKRPSRWFKLALDNLLVW